MTENTIMQAVEESSFLSIERQILKTVIAFAEPVQAPRTYARGEELSNILQQVIPDYYSEDMEPGRVPQDFNATYYRQFEDLGVVLETRLSLQRESGKYSSVEIEARMVPSSHLAYTGKQVEFVECETSFPNCSREQLSMLFAPYVKQEQTTTEPETRSVSDVYIDPAKFPEELLDHYSAGLKAEKPGLEALNIVVDAIINDNDKVDVDNSPQFYQVDCNRCLGKYHLELNIFNPTHETVEKAAQEFSTATGFFCENDEKIVEAAAYVRMARDIRTHCGKRFDDIPADHEYKQLYDRLLRQANETLANLPDFPASGLVDNYTTLSQALE